MVETGLIGALFMAGKIIAVGGVSFVIMDGMKTYNQFNGFKRGGNKNERNKNKSTSEKLKELNELQSQE